MHRLPANVPTRFYAALRRTTSNRTLQRLAEGEFAGPPDVEARLVQEEGKGEPLEESIRIQMENSLGADLRAVRIHRDAEANNLAREINAKAFTLGTDVFFASGEYAPETETGQRTLAHELAHVLQGVPGATLIVGSAYDPAEAEADAVAEQVVKRLQGEQTPTLQRQEEEEEEETIQAVRRQEEEEEEKEETVQTVRRTEAPHLSFTGAGAMLRRRVTVNVTTQTATREAIQAMTTIELREQIALLRQLPELEAPQRENLALMQAELTQREAALAAADVELLGRSCDRELQRLQFWMLSPGGLPLQTLRAFDSAVGNFLTNTEAGEASGIGFADVFGIILSAVPGVGPIARWVGSDAVRQALLAVAQAAASTAAQSIERGAEGATAQEERGARASFAAQVRREGAALADSLSRNTDRVLGVYGGAIDAARNAGNAEGLRILLVNLQHENDVARAVGVDRYNELSRQFEIELYKRFYQPRSYIYVIEHSVWGVMSREVEGIPASVQNALIRRLNAASNMLSLAYAWGLPERVTHTSGGRF